MDVRLIFVADEKSWYVTRAGSWYKVGVPECHGLLSILPLRAVSRYSLAETRSVGAYVVILNNDESATKLIFYSASGDEVAREELAFDRIPLSTVDWISGHYADGWIGQDAEVEAQADGELRFRLFLPMIDDSRDKDLTVECANEVLFTCTVPRGTLIETQPILLRSHSVTRLRLSSQYAEPATENDLRSLGFVVPDVLLDGQPATPGAL